MQGRPQDLGGQEFFPDLGIFRSQSDMLRMAKPCTLLGEFGGMLPRESFFLNGAIWCVFGVFSTDYHFFILKKIILDTRLLWGICHEEIFENMLRLTRFGVHFETKMASFIKK